MSYTNTQLVEVRECHPEHKGVFAKAKIRKDELIGFFDGKAVIVDLDRKDEFDTFWWRQSLHLRLDGSKLLCLLPQWEPDGVDFLNHSCRPTARVEDKLYVYADRDIDAGEEITVDYRTFNIIPEGIRCWCPNRSCVI
ncbi:MAG: SET domain-containing protein [Bauldia sp.]|nr:SET domain-containing protein [Bauldia sp.]